MLILDLWGISFHAVVVFGLGKNLLFKSILGRCGSAPCIHQTILELSEYSGILYMPLLSCKGVGIPSKIWWAKVFDRSIVEAVQELCH